jgi:simple sugar transport system permease protein
MMNPKRTEPVARGPRSTVATKTRQGGSALKWLRGLLRDHPTARALLTTLAVSAVFASLSSRFLTVENFVSVMTRVSETGIITIGITFLMISGEFDLSIASIYAVCGFLFAQLSNTGLFSPIAMILALVAAGLIGAVNGLITLRGHIPSFIATLGMSMILRGSLLGITGGSSLYYTGDEVVPKLLSAAMVLNIRPSHFWFIGIVVLFSVILNHSRYGNWVSATGGNREAARLMGVKTSKVKLTNFVISAVLAGFVGCIVSTRFRTIAPSFGTGLELEAIAASVIGGTLLMGGFGSIVGAALGALLVVIINNGLVLCGAPPYWYQTFIGLILIVTAIINLRSKGLGRES